MDKMEKSISLEKLDCPMLPQWLMYPGLSVYSMGWRMGNGEGYKYKFGDWYNTLSKDEKARYQAMFPAPKEWRDFYDEESSFDVMDEYYDKDILLWNKDGAMQYSRDWLIERQNSGEDLEYVFFWKRGNALYNCFSQWHYSEFEDGLEYYTSAEQYMMFKKAEIFEDNETATEIMATDDPKEIKALGRRVKGFDEEVWNRLRYSVVLNGNYYKFKPTIEMRDILLSTGDKILVEASPLDNIWGIGLSEKDAKAADPKSWRGLNLLGFALMEVRDEIRAVYQNYD